MAGRRHGRGSRRPCARAHVAVVAPFLAVLLAVNVAAASESHAPAGLIAPVRCVSDYLEALASAAPAHPVGTRRLPASTGADRRWARLRSYVAPSTLAALDRALEVPDPLAPWTALGASGAFLGYELLRARRAPRGAVVVSSIERTVRAPAANPEVVSCAYLVAPSASAWRIVEKRCGRDFADAEVLRGYQGRWNEPPPREEP